MKNCSILCRYSKEPKFLKKPLSTEAFEGDNITIYCEVTGDPKPEVVWLRDFLKVRLLFISKPNACFPHFNNIVSGRNCRTDSQTL